MVRPLPTQLPEEPPEDFSSSRTLPIPLLECGEAEDLVHELALVNARAAEMAAELEEQNATLTGANLALSRANVHAAELMVALELRDEQIHKLNKSLARANARAAELIIEREGKLADLSRLNQQLQHEVTERGKAEAEKQKLAEDLRRANCELERQSLMDPLTDTFNRRGIERVLRREQERAEAAGAKVGVLLLDIDNFKGVNSKHGHGVGDMVIFTIACRISRAMRSCDSLSRVGGDEFLMVISNVTEEELQDIAERVRGCVSGSPISVSGVRLQSSISVGAALLDDSINTVNQAVSRVAGALKVSKEQGKDQVHLLTLS